MSCSGLAGVSTSDLGFRWPVPGSQLGPVMLYEFENFADVYFGLKWLLLGPCRERKHMPTHLAFDARKRYLGTFTLGVWWGDGGGRTIRAPLLRFRSERGKRRRRHERENDGRHRKLRQQAVFGRLGLDGLP